MTARVASETSNRSGWTGTKFINPFAEKSKKAFANNADTGETARDEGETVRDEGETVRDEGETVRDELSLLNVALFAARL